jgi:hypothetical protein
MVMEWERKRADPWTSQDAGGWRCECTWVPAGCVGRCVYLGKVQREAERKYDGNLAFGTIKLFIRWPCTLVFCSRPS